MSSSRIRLLPKLPLIQIAGVMDRQEADMLVEEGVDLLGFPFRIDFHQEDLSEDNAASIISGLPGHTQAVLITYLRNAADILALCKRLGTTMVQLHGPIPIGEIQHLRSANLDLILIKALIVRNDNVAALLREAKEAADDVDLFITDTFDSKTGASGATGKIHGWNISRTLVQELPRPVILAGGLTPDNVAEAIAAVQLAGVDCHTGVEDRSGRKNRGLVRRFVKNARMAFSTLRAGASRDASR